MLFQHTAARRRLPRTPCSSLYSSSVSTHSRPKAAADTVRFRRQRDQSFNTQPPEGGCVSRGNPFKAFKGFQHTAARRRLRHSHRHPFPRNPFQHTAARRRLLKPEKNRVHTPLFQHTAARRRLPNVRPQGCNDQGRFNTQPPEGGCSYNKKYESRGGRVSTHSRPKAAAGRILLPVELNGRFNTQPPEGGCSYLGNGVAFFESFQHTAARRRLRCIF